MAVYSPQLRSEQLAALVKALLRSDRPRDGWVQVPDLAKESGMSRASAYRWLNYLEAAGWPLERDSDNCGRRVNTLGVRSLLIGHQREIDLRAHMRRAA